MDVDAMMSAFKPVRREFIGERQADQVQQNTEQVLNQIRDSFTTDRVEVTYELDANSHVLNGITLAAGVAKTVWHNRGRPYVAWRVSPTRDTVNAPLVTCTKQTDTLDAQSILLTSGTACVVYLEVFF